MKFNAEEDIVWKQRWAAHKDLINGVTFVPELQIFATCSFDCNVYMWDKTTCQQVGSLVLGTGTANDS
jgi:WD40 repeat protein